jgi:hypothetical protein
MMHIDRNSAAAFDEQGPAMEGSAGPGFFATPGPAIDHHPGGAGAAAPRADASPNDYRDRV